jgi:hypothetical protein
MLGESQSFWITYFNGEEAGYAFTTEAVLVYDSTRTMQTAYYGSKEFFVGLRTWEWNAEPIFNIDSEAVKTVRVQNGTTGKLVDYYDGKDIKALVDYLNSFRYTSWDTDPPGERDGWSYGISFVFDEKWEERVGYSFTNNAILVNGNWYFGSEEFFAGLINRIPTE